MLDVIVRGDFAQESRGESAIFLIILNQPVVFQDRSRSVDQVDSAFEELGIFFQFVQRNRVMLGIF